MQVVAHDGQYLAAFAVSAATVGVVGGALAHTLTGAAKQAAGRTRSADEPKEAVQRLPPLLMPPLSFPGMIEENIKYTSDEVSPRPEPYAQTLVKLVSGASSCTHD